MTQQNQNSKTNNLIIGGGLVFIGLVILFSRMNLLPDFPHWVVSWKTFLIALGLIFVLLKNKLGAGLIMISVGVFFLLPDIFYLPNFKRNFWPLILVAVGIAIMFKHFFNAEPRTIESDSMDYINDLAMFGGGEKSITSKNFKGGKVSAVFGGSELDFHGCELATGTNIIDIFAIFGGTNLKVPANWNVKTDVTAIFGGFSDKRRTYPDEIDESKTLVIKGFVLFGGGELSNA